MGKKQRRMIRSGYEIVISLLTLLPTIFADPIFTIDNQCSCGSLGLEWARCESSTCPTATIDNDYNEGNGHLECQIKEWDSGKTEQKMSCVSRRDGTCPVYFYPQPFLETFDHIYLDAYEYGGFTLLQSQGFGRQYTDFKMTMELSQEGSIPGTNVTQSVRLVSIFFHDSLGNDYLVELDAWDGSIYLNLPSGHRDIFSSDSRERDEIEFRFVRKNPHMVYFETWFGLNIDFWFKDIEEVRTIFAADIYLPLVYRTHTQGLCGNFNQDWADDLQKPDGTKGEVDDFFYEAKSETECESFVYSWSTNTD